MPGRAGREELAPVSHGLHVGKLPEVTALQEIVILLSCAVGNSRDNCNYPVHCCRSKAVR